MNIRASREKKKPIRWIWSKQNVNQKCESHSEYVNTNIQNASGCKSDTDQMQTFFTDNFGDIKYIVRFSSSNYKGYNLCKSNTDID